MSEPLGTEPPVTLPVDETSRARLAARGLRLSTVDHSDVAAVEKWLRVEYRGFLSPHPSQELLDGARAYQDDRRMTGVYDDALGDAGPVATSAAWVGDLTVPGGTTLPSWLISGVTVSPTHRRHGIATAMLEAELRTAASLDLPLAILTVSESTIYHRFGFGPATVLTGWEIDTKRIRWRGRDVTGRIAYADPAEFRATGRAVLDRIRRARIGEIAKTPVLADRLIGPLPGDPKKDDYRLVRFDDGNGECQGFLSYSLTGDDADFAMHTLEVRHLAAATDDAYLALWRFALEHDLVGLVKTFTAGDDEPLPLLVSDFRRARQTWREDHLWARILDVPRALASRSYERDGSIVFGIDDPLGFASGSWRLTVTDGAGAVERTADAPDVSLAVTALGSLYLGGMSARHLALRGEVTGDAGRLDALFRTSAPPHFGSWF